MIKELIETPSWTVVTDNGDKYIVNNSYNYPIGGTVIGLTKLDSGFYTEVNLVEFYRDFTFVLEESL